MDPRPVLSSLLLVSLLFAGCVEPAPSATIEDGAPLPLSLSADAEGCTLVVAVALPELGTAQAALPPGFTAADAQGLVGAPAPTGRAGVLITSYECGSGVLVPGALKGAEVNVLVEAPDVTGVDGAADTHYYQLALYTDSAELAAALAPSGWPVFSATTEAATNVAGPATAGTGRAEDDAGLVYAFDTTVAAASSLAGVSRFWHDTPVGVAYWDYEVAADVLVGGASCEMRAGTPAAHAAGTTECGRDSIGIIAPSFSWKSTFVHVPDAEVQA